MSTGAKIAIGCGVLVVLTGLAAVVGIVGFGFWAKGKAETALAGAQEEIAEHSRIQQILDSANENAFTPPPDGVLSEARLVAFLDVRKRVFTVYEANKDEIDAFGRQQSGQEPSLTDLAKGLTKGFAILNQLRLARAQGLVATGMSEAEYAHLVAAVYTSMIASEVGKATGEKSVSEATSEHLKEAARQMEAQADATPDPNLPPEAQQAFKDAQEQMRQAQRALERESAEAAGRKDADVPPQNIALFRKYEEEIKKYAMSGLEWAGL
jgi:hypothetical protein